MLPSSHPKNTQPQLRTRVAAAIDRRKNAKVERNEHMGRGAPTPASASTSLASSARQPAPPALPNTPGPRQSRQMIPSKG